MCDYQSPDYCPPFLFLFADDSFSNFTWKVEAVNPFCEASESVVHAGDVKQAMSPYDDIITKMETGVMCDSSTCPSQSPIK